MPWYLYLALKQLFPSGKYISFFAVVSILGVAIGVGVLYGSMCIMNGFQMEIRDKIRDTNGDIRLVTNELMTDWEAVKAKVETITEVVTANPYVMGIVMATHEDHPAFPIVWAIDPSQDKQVIPFEEKNYLLQGKLSDLDDESIIVSIGAARELQLGIGDVMEIYTPLMIDRLKNDEVILPRELTVVGIYETGWSQTDENTIIVSVRLMQELYGLGTDVHGISIRIDDKAKAHRIADELELLLGNGYRTMTWLELQEDLLGVLAMEKAVIFLITAFIVLIAVFLILAIMLLNVIRKTREIGVLGAIGAQSAHLSIVYCIQGLVICTLGITLGLISAYLILMRITEILTFLFMLFGVDQAIISYYQFKQLPINYSYEDLTLIIFGTYVLTFAATLIPAIKATRLRPADALRYE